MLFVTQNLNYIYIIDDDILEWYLSKCIATSSCLFPKLCFHVGEYLQSSLLLARNCPYILGRYIWTKYCRRLFGSKKKPLNFFTCHTYIGQDHDEIESHVEFALCDKSRWNGAPSTVHKPWYHNSPYSLFDPSIKIE